MMFFSLKKVRGVSRSADANGGLGKGRASALFPSGAWGQSHQQAAWVYTHALLA